MALGTYNRTPANRTSGAMIYEIQYEMLTSMTLAVDIGVQYACAYNCTGELQADMDLWWGYDERYALEASITAQADAAVWVRMLYSMVAQADLSANPVLEAVYRLAGSLTAEASGYVMVRQLWGPFVESMTMEASGVQTRRIVLTLEDLAIPAGATVVIDCENYAITLDGENIIDRYEGDWFYFTPQLEGVDVESGTSGALHVSILYREKYL